MLSSLADESFFITFFVEEDKSSLVISKKLKLVKEDKSSLVISKKLKLVKED